jgi:CheY-like chemotaxis protein
MPRRTRYSLKSTLLDKRTPVRSSGRGSGAAACGGGPPSRRTGGRTKGARTTADKALILIVDDDFDFVEINRLVLERAGYRVTTAPEPQTALKKMAEEKPDLVISDLMMNALDSGFALARSIKGDPRFADIPVILSTSVSSAIGLDFRPRSAEETKQMNVDAYFDKPLIPALLLAKVEELLARKGDHKTSAAASEDNG